QTGTINPASFYGEKFGQIKEGYEADFILLESNPFENIENLKKPWGVMARGKWLDRATINSRLQQIAANYATNQYALTTRIKQFINNNSDYGYRRSKLFQRHEGFWIYNSRRGWQRRFCTQNRNKSRFV